ncbi:MAG: DUF3536 domain-containing protein [Acidobacteriaceae bacterium]
MPQRGTEPQAADSRQISGVRAAATPSAPPAPASVAGSSAKDGKKYICIHGHFYQPPRDNPWLETIELQESAAPYHDWNDRVTAECYAPNGASRIVNLKNEIIRIVNNYSRMSFNFGPTLLSWLEGYAPRTYRMVLDADTRSRARYGGHGSAMAQVYNHVIMPLANDRDALTQIRWGIADFEHRFARKPEGMWLAETAVDRRTLDLMAQEGILFTILAPRQCARIRDIAKPGLAPIGHLDAPWSETPNASVDPTRPYKVNLEQGRSIAVFFYDGAISQAVAFEGLLNSGEAFERRLMSGLHPPVGGEPQLVHIATDGESYGHHHKHGEMALSYAMHLVEQNSDAKLTNYGEFLEKFPPTHEAEVVEDSSWSCEHGVERWRSNCGCNSGTKPGWHQLWRGPLRDALDWLRDTTTPLAEKMAEGLFKNLWAARDAYIKVILDRSTTSQDAFFAAHATHVLSAEERIAALKLMELERQAQLMYTSCGWFFDEVSGIETVQIIAYAARLIQLAAELFGPAGQVLEAEFVGRLAAAKSNLATIGDGAAVYEKYVKPMRIGLEQVGAHYAISSIFRSYPDEGDIFCYDVKREQYEVFTSGRGRLAIGRAQIHSRITEEAEDISFAVLHLGDQNLSAAVKRCAPEDADGFARFTNEVRTAITRADLPEVIRQIDHCFGQTAYSLSSLFADEEHRILRTILDATLSEVETSLQRIYEDHASLLHYLTESGMSKPPALALAANFALNAGLRRAFEVERFDAGLIQTLLQRARTDQVTLDEQLLGYAASQRMKRALVQLEAKVEAEKSTSSQEALQALEEALTIAETVAALPIEVNLWQSQNIWNDLLRRSNGEWESEWNDLYMALGRKLNIAVDQLVVEESVVTF